MFRLACTLLRIVWSLIFSVSACVCVCVGGSVGMASIHTLFRPVGVRGRGNRCHHIYWLCPDAGRPQVWPQFKVRD